MFKLLFLSLFLASFQSKVIELYEKDLMNRESPVKGEVGDIFRIKLGGPSGTGYNWYLEDNYFDIKDYLKKLNLNEENSAPFKVDTENMPGARGHFIFEFEAVAQSGERELELTFFYKRPWEDYEFQKFKTRIVVI